MRGSLLLAGLSWQLLAGPVAAATYLVEPDGTGDFPMIQAAIDASVAGDVIELADGTFTGIGNRDLDYLGKAITVGSRSGNPENCTIDCQGMNRGVSFISGEGSGSVLEGVTVRNGYADEGGGVRCDGSSPRIVGCRFYDGRAREGAGVHCLDAAPHFDHCAFSGGHANGGGAVSSFGNADLEFESCFFGLNSAFGGGGISQSGGSLRVTDCVFSGDSARDGGAIEIWGTLVLTDCEFRDNRADFSGGALNLRGGSATVASCRFTRNQSGDGGAIAWSASSGSVSLCTFLANNGVDGAAIFCGYTPLTVAGCTFATQTSSFTSVLFAFGAGARLTVRNSVLAFNQTPPVQCAALGVVEVACSDLFGNHLGDWVDCIEDQGGMSGNFSADPLFCDLEGGDLRLQEGSPCSPEHNPDCGLIGAWPVGCGSPPPVGACCLAGAVCEELTAVECSRQHGMYHGDEIPCEPNPCQPIPTEATSWGRIKGMFRDKP